MILIAVFLLSLSSIAFEVLLTRVFSISQWHHLAFMVISIALFGFAAAGTLISMLETGKSEWRKYFSTSTSLSLIVLLYSLSALISFSALHVIPLDYFRLPFEPVQLLYLFAIYLLLTLPFFFAGLLLCLAYVLLPQKTGIIYCTGMIGSAAGALLPALLLPWFKNSGSIVFISLLPLVFILLNRFQNHNGDICVVPKSAFSFGKYGTLLISALAILLLASLFSAKMFPVSPSPHKALSKLLRYPDSHVNRSISGIRGRLDLAQSPYIRFAPGLSLKFNQHLPPQWALYKDGDRPLVFYQLNTLADVEFSKFTLSYAGYTLIPNPQQVLLIQKNGGISIPCAKAAAAKEITLVQPDPRIAQILHNVYALTVVNDSPRAYLARSQKRFDIIHVENWGASIPGSAVLEQDYLLTRQALDAYLRHLNTSGVLIISRKLLLPPSDSVRLFAVAFESLISYQIKDPLKHMAMLRSWDTYVLIVSPSPLNTKPLHDFSRKMNFDLVSIRDMHPKAANRFNVFDEPFHYNAIDRLKDAYGQNRSRRFLNAHLLDVSAQSDNRPFPERFLKWRHIKKVYAMKGSRFHTLLMSGEVLVMAVLGIAFFIACLLYLIPIFFISKKHQAAGTYTVFFLGIGAGFMFVELFLIQKLILLFEDPVISLSMVLGGIMIFSSIGGIFSQRLRSKDLWVSLFGLTVSLLLLWVSIDFLLPNMLRLSLPLRYLFSMFLLAPVGIMLGIPFPLGMRLLPNAPLQRANAWTANGCASVLSAIVSIQIALSAGINRILLCAVGFYLLSLISLVGFRKKAR